ncbi:MAG TPA: hypothetical protein VK871_05370 [Candidatus Limnocylindrales bacterium]|nr:hypothetical protein [Candidatus Limnocylindrales bacterium]
MSERVRFPIRIGRRSRPVVRLFGASPETAWAELDGDLEIRFGRFRIGTPVSNLARWRIEGPFVWIKAIGVRMSLRGGDVSFAGSAHGGVRIDLVERVRWGPFRVPAVWIGADDLDGLAAELLRRGIPGEDARRA